MTWPLIAGLRKHMMLKISASDDVCAGLKHFGELSLKSFL